MTDKPSEGSSISDEDWEKFVQDAERDQVAAPKEPSARARMVTERLRQQEARGEEPAGWRTGPAWQDVNGRGSRRRKVWSAIGVLLAVGVAVVALKPSLALPGSDSEPAPASPLAPETSRPSGAPADAAGLPTRQRPFTGSPAARWAAGAAAIEVPKAESVSGVSAARIRTALRLTKDFVVAANLDREVLYGAEPEAALALVDPLQKDYLADLRSALRRPTAKNDPTWTFTRFDPDEVELVGTEVKVRGRMTVEPDGAGKAMIRADYTFVYPLAKTGGGDEVARAIVRRVVEVDVADPAEYRGTEGRIWVYRIDGEISNDDCEIGDGRIHPLFRSDLMSGPESSGEAIDPYDRSRGVDRGTEECGTVSRT
ncbi:hypothetical protein [Streptomyces chartreusis]|uniref:hypothetical protein n=1 Tax=Streptomyces chartreusis TaxID=1969 RepID=UPI002E81331D|nr:hypothetical protein [Streptomyces chartreusis]WUB20108.1 hypothetical protein OG997_26895 [Streptomyces chartreusis]